jgi:DNA mismatch endonuclease (patch repair protein)
MPEGLSSKRENAQRLGLHKAEKMRKTVTSARGAGENWVSTPSSASLSGRLSRNTGPEMLLRRALHRRGLRYRVHTRIGERLTLDIEFVAAKVGVFCDGHYWHACPDHPRTPPRGPNAEAWASKFSRIDAREARASEILRQRGYEVIRLRQCQIAADPDAAAEEIETVVQRRRPAAGRLLA